MFVPEFSICQQDFAMSQSKPEGPPVGDEISNGDRELKMDRPANRSPWSRRVRRWLIRGVLLLAVLVSGWLLIILVGLIPVNNDFIPSENGIEIFLVSNSVHSDIILPLDHPEFSWRDQFAAEDFDDDISVATHVAIGWGDKGFFISTPTWEDLKASTVANALFWPSGTCMHVNMTRADFLTSDARSVKISRPQFMQLSKSIQASFKGAGVPITPIDCANYGTSDRFYEARGSYHLFNTCNSWVGVQLRAAGVKTPWNPILPGTPFLYFPDKQRSE